MPCFLQSVAVYTGWVYKGKYDPELLKGVSHEMDLDRMVRS